MKRFNYGRTALLVWAALVLIFTLMPVLIVFPFAFNSANYLAFPPSGFSLRWFESFFADASWTGTALQSLKLATLTTILSVVVGTMAAFAIVRKRMRFGSVMSTFLLFPMVGPHIVFAVGMFGLFSDLNLTGTTTGLVLAHSLVATPFVYINVASRLGTFDHRLEMAAQSLGASPLTSFLRITAPIISPAIVAGGLFAFLTSWDEFIVTYFTADPDTQTLPLRIFSGIQYGVDVTTAAAAAMIISILVLAVVLYRLSAIWSNRRMRRL